ncbi:MAG TPA: tRNA (adenosine(37)-N6)-dimethylallyltransferase MiaA [Candidatus Agrococcus pullicola]|uniref:tRNA dimethylallyltransferase n=1 Tax=Candidatus Agrococcus pullicola TaxID=2838429 RepID=A0A9D1YUR7_9MICO|nr:tRNA (adenosine(37)-N6)-dimethylallyltransferase MiaA [Candidatus Agrococcus pullicola]
MDAVEVLAARGIRAEIVNADAMQLYRGMDIATAKLRPEERRGIPHHMLDILDVTEGSTAAGYQTVVESLIEQLESEGVWPILVGGSGLYISAVLFGFAFPARDPELRARLERELENEGPDVLHERLRQLDPRAAADIDPANGRRTVRALEAVTVTGQPFRASLPSSEPVRPTRIAHLRAERALLVERLDARVEGFWRAGLLDEVQTLRDQGLEQGTTARQAIGYAQALQQLGGELTEAEAIDATKLATRKYSRRQVSWFKRYVADEPAPNAARDWIASVLD